MENLKRKLGALETAQAITNIKYPFNAVCILQINNGPDLTTLQDAVNQLQENHTLLAARLQKEEKKFFFIWNDSIEIKIKSIHRENEDTWRHITEEQLNKPTDFYNGPMLNIHYITDPAASDKSELILTFHHAIIDASSGSNLIDELLTLCSQQISLQKKEKQKKRNIHPPAEFFFPINFKGIKGKWNGFLNMIRMVGDEFYYRIRTISSRKAPIHSSAYGKTLSIIFSELTSSQLLKKVRKKGLTINSLFNAAILKATHINLYNNKSLPLRYFSFTDLRPFLIPPVPPEITGSYFSMLRFTSYLRSNLSLIDLAGKIQSKIYISLKRGDKFSAYRQSPGMMKALIYFKSFRMAATALSYIGKVNVKPSYGEIKLRHLHIFTSNFVLGPEYTAQTRLFNNQFYWDILYLDSDMNEIKAKKIADDIRELIENFIMETV